jgi:Leucine-rich repeat (LRR) protein
MRFDLHWEEGTPPSKKMLLDDLLLAVHLLNASDDQVDIDFAEHMVHLALDAMRTVYHNNTWLPDADRRDILTQLDELAFSIKHEVRVLSSQLSRFLLEGKQPIWDGPLERRRAMWQKKVLEELEEGRKQGSDGLSIMYYNELNGLPPEIGNFRNLRHISVIGCSLITLPPEIGSLTNLISLSLYENSLEYLPVQIGNLRRLEKMNLEINALSSLPREIACLTELKDLSLAYNRFELLPLEVCQLGNLRRLRLSANPISSLPREIVKLHQLEELDLEGTGLTGLPSEVQELRRRNLKKVRI